MFAVKCKHIEEWKCKIGKIEPMKHKLKSKTKMHQDEFRVEHASTLSPFLWSTTTFTSLANMW